ncbi:hypothetical protein [Methylobacterium bullatum]|uniref:Uncharacterized protein n=1 Tax=Methylobacterium bullatum TaxID=570505 RepID=A0AAV4Z826_9HYPH|nr:hypothetical protein [Methylobacterium bullatum]MBD8901379.1 hypothetical protein [Methylobacterium bullatum]GJD40080.1 hypothetical protein OICFNHDK_2545 [Methylobacterium bullatum]
MSNVVRFPASRRIQATTIPRAEFERLAELALDIVDRIVALLDEADGDPDRETDTDQEPDVEGEPSLGAPEGHESQVTWLRGGSRDLESC